VNLTLAEMEFKQPPTGAAGIESRVPSRSDDDESAQDASLNFLERLDRRQNQLLEQLDRLNARIEHVLDGYRSA
jgi:hypothetical protein